MSPGRLRCVPIDVSATIKSCRGLSGLVARPCVKAAFRALCIVGMKVTSVRVRPYQKPLTIDKSVGCGEFMLAAI